jgi:hypothetical protein
LAPTHINNQTTGLQVTCSFKGFQEIVRKCVNLKESHHKLLPAIHRRVCEGQKLLKKNHLQLAIGIINAINYILKNIVKSA